METEYLINYELKQFTKEYDILDKKINNEDSFVINKYYNYLDDMLIDNLNEHNINYDWINIISGYTYIFEKQASNKDFIRFNVELKISIIFDLYEHYIKNKPRKYACVFGNVNFTLFYNKNNNNIYISNNDKKFLVPPLKYIVTDFYSIEKYNNDFCIGETVLKFNETDKKYIINDRENIIYSYDIIHSYY